jgi:hypothetical protein
LQHEIDVLSGLSGLTFREFWKRIITFTFISRTAEFLQIQLRLVGNAGVLDIPYAVLPGTPSLPMHVIPAAIVMQPRQPTTCPL